MELNYIDSYKLSEALLRELACNYLQPIIWKACFTSDSVTIDVSEENKQKTITFLKEKYNLKLKHTAVYKIYNVCTYTLTFEVPDYKELITLLNFYGWKV